MGDRSSIEWTDATWNPVVGCDRVSPGCDNCYAIAQAIRIQRMGTSSAYEGTTTADGDWSGLVKCLPERLDQPLRWRRPRQIFVNSMSDLFHPDVPDAFIVDVFAVMAAAPQHVFQILTKRPQRMAALLAVDDFTGAVSEATAARIEPRPASEAIEVPPLSNVWLGTSIESDRYTFRANHLRSTPASVRFLSLEPLLGPLPSLDLHQIDWVIVGGESGPNARPLEVEWVRHIRERSLAAGVPFFFKQWGGRTAKSGGRELDGRTWDEEPFVLSQR
ncbi:MAG: phage Gp37/Gp68 family protein [Acidimicrobiia bacterium]